MSDKGVFTDAWHQNVARVLDEVKVERVRQHNKFGTQNHAIAIWFLILGEEYGEANTDALESLLAGDVERMRLCRKELLEVAAVAVVMVESLDRNELAAAKPVRVAKPVFDFEVPYQKLYPNKQGKVVGMLECKKQIKTAEDYALWLRAMELYHNYHTRPAAPGEFKPTAKHFDSFMRQGKWREVLDASWARVENEKPKVVVPPAVVCELEEVTARGESLCRHHSPGVPHCEFTKTQKLNGYKGH